MWGKTIKHAFSMFYNLIKYGFLTNQSSCRVLSVLESLKMLCSNLSTLCFDSDCKDAVADPDLELRVVVGGGGGGGVNLLALLTFLPSVISSFFTQNKREGGQAPRAPLDLPLGCTV